MLIALIALPWGLIAYHFLPFNNATSRSGFAPFSIGTSRFKKKSAATVAKGPWGAIEIEEIVIEPPAKMFRYNLDLSPREWFLTDTPVDKLSGILQACGIPGSTIAEIERYSAADQSTTGTVIRAPDNLVWNLDPRSRERLYSLLGRYPGNVACHHPYFYRGESLEEWLHDTPLPADIIDRIASLVYKRDNQLLFSDIDLIWPLVKSPLDRLALMQILHRETSHLVRLKVDDDAGIDGLVSYWGVNNREETIRTMLESTLRGRQSSIDLIYLLPPIPRVRLNTYSGVTHSDSVIRHNCFWAALNFFNDTPDDSLTAGNLAAARLSSDYMRIEENDICFGDIFAICRKDGTLLHTCVYIAADIVYTKDGEETQNPFVLKRISDVIPNYRRDGPISCVYFRLREP